MAVKIGSARSSFGNTAAGDQHGGLEVSTQSYYLHSLGWKVYRCKDPDKAELIARAMDRACANNDIGYSQGSRLTLTKNVQPYGYDPARTTKKVNTDCSALVRCCCLHAGINVGDFITSNEPAKLMATGAFVELTGEKYTKKSDYLKRGDIMVTRTKGHTVVVLSNGSKAEAVAKPVEYHLGDRDLENGCEGDDVKELQNYLIQIGYSCGEWGADGDFGDATEEAVRRFQRDKGCDVDGVVGSETIAAINAALGTDDDPSPKYTRIRITGACYVREEPNTKGKKISSVAKGGLYAYAGKTSSDGWHLIMYGGRQGWVSGKYSKGE